MQTLQLLFLCLLYLSLLSLLTACTESGPEQDFERYLSRLARTLEQDIPERQTPELPHAPRTGALRLELAASKLDTLDFLALSGCAVQVTIGKRNSSLGRMASDSQRLLLDLEYLQLAPACIASMRAKARHPLADTLAAARALKIRQLPARIFNATLANTEYRQFWRLPTTLQDYPQQTSSAVVTALAAINLSASRWLGGDYQFDNREFEILLSEVASGDGGTLLSALAMQSEMLASADRMTELRLRRGPLCPPGLRPVAADILDTVIHKYFIAALQPWSAAVERRRHDLLPAISELESLLQAAIPSEYLAWQQRRDALLGQWAAAPRRHVQALLDLRQSCNER